MVAPPLPWAACSKLDNPLREETFPKTPLQGLPTLQQIDTPGHLGAVCAIPVPPDISPAFFHTSCLSVLFDSPHPVLCDCATIPFPHLWVCIIYVFMLRYAKRNLSVYAMAGVTTLQNAFTLSPVTLFLCAFVQVREKQICAVSCFGSAA